jgi:hypothetical protein
MRLPVKGMFEVVEELRAERRRDEKKKNDHVETRHAPGRLHGKSRG